uniref:Uncharacterized protein n=1 Tax=Arundo donax TaxID=35708 RepID=A0A0A9E1X2_ARUDO
MKFQMNLMIGDCWAPNRSFIRRQNRTRKNQTKSKKVPPRENLSTPAEWAPPDHVTVPHRPESRRPEANPTPQTPPRHRSGARTSHQSRLTSIPL